MIEINLSWLEDSRVLCSICSERLSTKFNQDGDENENILWIIDVCDRLTSNRWVMKNIYEILRTWKCDISLRNLKMKAKFLHCNSFIDWRCFCFEMCYFYTFPMWNYRYARDLNVCSITYALREKKRRKFVSLSG